VDVDARDEPEVIAACLVREATADDDRIEVGYRRGRRVALQPVDAPLDTRTRPAIALAPGEPLLVTGGARGITAAVTADLAERWQPNLLVIGTSPLPPETEDPETAGRDAPTELKAILHAQLKRRARPAGLIDVERAYQALRKGREIRTSLSCFRDAGSTVHYAQADVRDAEELGRLLADWRRRFGDPVGLIHGAGVIQDKLLRDKKPESFDRVLKTKVDGALTLARLLRPEPLRFAAFFSSVAGRFGNRGQGDYAAANEALNKLAIWLDGRWSARVVSLIWGPWSGIGMVSDLEGHLGRQGMAMIPPQLGRSRLADELAYGRKGEVEIIVAGDLGSLVEPWHAERACRPVGAHG
jgi:NAD(P)-dependent dehydrogenase (short-subunit alcohol dehydrogenase family)